MAWRRPVVALQGEPPEPRGGSQAVTLLCDFQRLIAAASLEVSTWAVLCLLTVMEKPTTNPQTFLPRDRQNHGGQKSRSVRVRALGAQKPRAVRCTGTRSAHGRPRRTVGQRVRCGAVTPGGAPGVHFVRERCSQGQRAPAEPQGPGNSQGSAFLAGYVTLHE